MAIGRLDERVTLQARTETQDAAGQSSASWTTVGDVWADAETLSGREFYAAQQAQQGVAVRIRIRYRSDISSLHRVIWRGAAHDIKAVIERNESRRNYVDLMCTAGTSIAQ